MIDLSQNDIKKFKQLRKQLEELETGSQVAQQLVDEITGTRKKVSVSSKKMTRKDWENKFLNS